MSTTHVKRSADEIQAIMEFMSDPETRESTEAAKYILAHLDDSRTTQTDQEWEELIYCASYISGYHDGHFDYAFNFGKREDQSSLIKIASWDKGYADGYHAGKKSAFKIIARLRETRLIPNQHSFNAKGALPYG